MNELLKLLLYVIPSILVGLSIIHDDCMHGKSIGAVINKKFQWVCGYSTVLPLPDSAQSRVYIHLYTWLCVCWYTE